MTVIEKNSAWLLKQNGKHMLIQKHRKYVVLYLTNSEAANTSCKIDYIL